MVGFRTRVEPSQNCLVSFLCSADDQDDTAMNGIELICKNGKSITSSYENRGDWNSAISYCPNNNAVKGFEYGMESFGRSDDTTMNVIRLICYDDTIKYSSESGWSSSFITHFCPVGVLTGLRTQVDPYRNSGYDDICLNNVEFICEII